MKKLNTVEHPQVLNQKENCVFNRQIDKSITECYALTDYVCNKEKCPFFKSKYEYDFEDFNIYK